MKTLPFPGLLRALPRGGSKALTRLDLLFLLATVALVALVAWPALAHTKPRADLAVCANNLRLVGRAEHIWASDHGDVFPWRVPWGGTGSEGGTRGHPLNSLAWLHYSFMSNELVNPSILVCPSDTAKRAAADWSQSPNGGFLDANHRNNAITYFIGLDSFLGFAPLAWPSPTVAALAGDRHLFVDYQIGRCSSGVSSAAAIYVAQYGTQSRAQWTNAVHGPVGNVLSVDGQVSLTSTSRVAWAITGLSDDNGVFHILLPN
jgi:hypothetical protein